MENLMEFANVLQGLTSVVAQLVERVDHLSAPTSGNHPTNTEDIEAAQEKLRKAYEEKMRSLPIDYDRIKRNLYRPEQKH